MKKCKIGILLTALAIALALTLTGCFRRRDEDKTTTTKEQGSSLLPSPESPLLPDESETDSTETTQKESDTQSSRQETTSVTTPATTTKAETTTKTTTKAETTTKATTKAETTTKATTKAETTTKATTKQETTTTTKPQTSATTQTTSPSSTTTTRGETDNSSSATSESGGITDPITPPAGGTGSGTTTQNQTSDPNVPESGAGEWIHFEDFKDDHLGAIAFLGRSAQKLTPADVISYFGLSLLPEDITVIDNGDSEDGDGDQWYLILPRYRDTTVRLHEAETENGESVAGELLAEGMHPMLVRCDPEDGTPSVFVELTRGDAKISFPLLVDGTMEKPTFHKNMLDISPTQSAPARNRRRSR